MHILFIGYGKTSQRLAKQLFPHGHQITTISQSAKTDSFATHLLQDVHALNLQQLAPIDTAYVLLAPPESSVAAYQWTYVDSVQPIVAALASHPIKRIIVVSSTRIYGENAGEKIDDNSATLPSDEQGHLLLEMERLYQAAYPEACVIVRPTGIYTGSSARMQKLAETTHHYPNVHWSNRIHIDDLVGFLAFLLHVEHTEKSYICSNNLPHPLHERIREMQRAMHLPELVLDSQRQTGKRIFAERMQQSGFRLQHDEC